MLRALEQYRHAYTFTVEMLDVDADEDLLARYDELVPVLMGSRAGQAPRQLCHYFLDPGQVEHFLKDRD
ncbi:hypothetical protein FHW67_000741 [Herbaspirillum sp. Sphag1AN]|nr:hypothetical protein [Herbaspirillum sp. Sphag1AN]MBB3245241.1 hypothetical protein [Herbaspirillum sp. Sphag64]